MRYLIPISTLRKRDIIGNKASSLQYLHRKRFRIPNTLVIPTRAHIDYLNDQSTTLQKLERELKNRLDWSKLYAVRSSAEIEDGIDHTFAGQFKTVLNLNGSSKILQAVQQVWNVSDEVRTSMYKHKVNDEDNPIHMAVIIQEMVQPVWAGVAFSINPITGRDEIVIEGIEGSAVKLVQEGKDPERWIFTRGLWINDVEDPDYKSPGKVVLDELVSNIKRLRSAWKAEVDVEWTYDGKEVFYLQSRVVTTRKYPTIYSNHISREFLPGMIKPLVWSLNIPLVNGAWLKLLKKLLGRLDIAPEELSKLFYYRAYFNMGTMGTLFQLLGLPKKSLEYLMGFQDPSTRKSFRPGFRFLIFLPRIVLYLISNIRLGNRSESWIDHVTTEIDEINRTLEDNWDIRNYQDTYNQIMSKVQQAAYYNITVPLAMHLVNLLLKRRLKRLKLSLDQLDFTRDFPVLKEYNPQYRIEYLRTLWDAIPQENQRSILCYSDLHSGQASEPLKQFLQEFHNFINVFGYVSESGNDISYPHWKENPDLVLNLIRNAAGGTLHEKREIRSVHKESLISKLRKAYRRAGSYRVYREMISSEYTREYGLFRKLFLKTGDYLFRKGALKTQQDVFFLTLEEHDRLIMEKESFDNKDIQALVQKRKKEMNEYENISLPSVIYGEVPPPLKKNHDTIFEGIPTSPGHFQGKIVVVRNSSDFNKQMDGAILLIPFADVSWTPVLVRAGAIVSESGGMLSHAAIVAREFSIPAISSVEGACQLEDGTEALVDGYNGILLI